MNISSQLRELAIAYGLTAVAMLIGLIFMRADRRAYFRWPVYSVMVMALSVIVWNMVRSRWLPVEWTSAHTSTVYYAVLTLYFVMGLATGVLLGRLTRGARPGNRENLDIDSK